MATVLKMKLQFFSLALAVSMLLIGCHREYPGIDYVNIQGERFTVELATTEEQRIQGMSGRDSFPEGGVMLFVFPDEALRSFWMYECLIDIDIIFLDSRGFVTATHRMQAEPLRQPEESELDYERRLTRYSSIRPAQFAIELPEGSLDRLGVRVDDHIELAIDRLKAMADNAD